uniref:protein-serine/threonine phosphatase n=1 Tax=Cacopsylla melanoneura TaxID=428564 RepID=A0A8D8YI62_9HEMI
MGAYLSQPITKKESSDHEGPNVSCGSSSMQGWRIYQEDAHNVIIDFDEKKSLFAVYDGHGGSEVAIYTSKHLPRFIKNTEEFKKGNYKQALIDAFMEFDENLIKDEVMAILKDLKKENEGDDSYPATDEDALDDDDDGDNVNNLYEEATMPLSEVISRYRNPGIQRLKESGDMSPRLKSKDKKSSEGSGEGCSSSSSGVTGSSSCAASSSSSSSSPKSSKVSKSDAPSSSSSSSVEATPPAAATTTATSTDSASSSSKPEPSSDSSAQPAPTASTEASSSSSAIKDEKESNGPAASNVSSSKPDANGSGEKKKENGETNGEAKATEEEAVISSSDVKPFKGKAKDKPVITNGDTEVDSSAAHALSNGNNKPQRTSPRKTLGTRNLLDNTMDDDSSESDEDFQMDEDLQGSSSDSDEGDEHIIAAARNLPPIDSDEDDDDDEELEEEEEDSDEDDSDYEEGEGGALSPEDLQKRMKEALDHKDVPGMDSGCTAVVVLFVDNQIYIANAGDSRAVLCRGTTALDLSEDHKPEDDVERARIVKAGGEVTPDGRVNGGLNLSRALGDHSYKQTTSLPLSDQMITALPDVTVQTLQPDDQFIIIACDGIWNSLSSQEVVDFVRERIDKPDKKLSAICEELFDKCLAPDSLGDGTGCDNMTCVLVRLHGNRGPVESHAHSSSSAQAATKRTREEEEEAETKPSAKKTKTEGNEAAEAVAKITSEESMAVESTTDAAAAKSVTESTEEVGSST